MKSQSIFQVELALSLFGFGSIGPELADMSGWVEAPGVIFGHLEKFDDQKVKNMKANVP